MHINCHAGIGKTFLLNSIVSRLRADRKIALCTAIKSIAATDSPRSIAAQCTFKVPVRENPKHPDKLQSKVSHDPGKAKLLRRVSVAI